MPLGHQVLILFAVTNGYLDDTPVSEVRNWEKVFHNFVDTSHPEVLRIIESEGDLKPETETLIRSVILECKAVMTED